MNPTIGEFGLKRSEPYALVSDEYEMCNISEYTV